MASTDQIRQGNQALERANDRLTRKRSELQQAQNQAIKDLEKAKDESKKTIELEGSLNKSTQDRVKLQGEKQISDLNQLYNERKNSTIKQGQEQIQKLLENTTKRLKVLQDHAEGKISSVTKANTQQLQAFTEKLEDPFYKPLTLPVQFQENEQFVEAKVALPEHEAKNLLAFIDHDKLSLSLSRRTQNESELKPGQINRSAKFQTVTEAFKIQERVNTEKMTKEYKDGVVTVKVPKLSRLIPAEKPVDLPSTNISDQNS